LEALQELVQIKPDIKGKEIYFFPTLKKYFKGHRSALATIFLEPNPTCQSIASILCETNYEPYWKTVLLINAQDILLNIKEKILPGKEFSGTAIQEINEGLEFKFAMKDGQPEKKLIIFSKNGLHSYEIHILNKIVQDIYLPFSIKAMKRTIDDIINIIRYVFSVKVCCGQNTA
ncbi:3938_t:CDS:2, partial [Diversispora eburnea]